MNIPRSQCLTLVLWFIRQNSTIWIIMCIMWMCSKLTSISGCSGHSVRRVLSKTHHNNCSHLWRPISHLFHLILVFGKFSIQSWDLLVNGLGTRINLQVNNTNIDALMLFHNLTNKSLASSTLPIDSNQVFIAQPRQKTCRTGWCQQSKRHTDRCELTSSSKRV